MTLTTCPITILSKQPEGLLLIWHLGTLVVIYLIYKRKFVKYHHGSYIYPCFIIHVLLLVLEEFLQPMRLFLPSYFHSLWDVLVSPLRSKPTGARPISLVRTIGILSLAPSTLSFFFFFFLWQTCEVSQNSTCTNP